MNTCECGAESTEVVVTFTSWVIEVCHHCAVRFCDPLRGTG